jgi:hypothetical protein
MGEAARSHRKIANNIRELVINPFARWCEQHAARVQNSQDDLQGRIRSHDRQADTVRQYRSSYFNKCRRVEDLDEEEKLAFQDPNSTAAAATTGSPKPTPPQSVPSIKVDEQEDDPEPVEIGDQLYQPDQVKKMLTHVLENIRLGEAKVPILGTYQNVTSGAEIVEYIQKNMGGSNVSYAERIGQDLINNGFLRLIGNMGSTFANSSKMNYQWRTKVFEITGIPEKRPKLGARSTTLSSVNSDSTPQSPVLGDRMSEMWGSGWNPLNNANETPAQKLRREARDADERYKAAVRKLDGIRCNLEEAIIDHLKFMERCELDRLKAIKSVILDFSGAVSNVIPSLQSSVDNMMLFQETVQPLGDLRYFLENYRTGSYIPKVVTYENYYNQVDEQAFGVDIEARARADRKRVPLIVTTILTFLDSHYPDLEGDEARRSIWVVDVPLSATHHLRNNINTGKPIDMELLEKYEVPIVASALKLYLLELPDSLVSSHVYEIVKTIYTSTAQSSSEQARITVIQSTLGQLRLANIATLDALVTHFSRLIELTSADEAYISNLATVLAPCFLRPKQETGLSMAEKYNVRLIRDLFAHKDAIFGELKRQSSLTHTNSGTRQTRAISTDESKRKEAMEERQRAIAAAQQAQAGASSGRSRQPSPSPGARVPVEGTMHRRDRSRGPETRFPVATTATTAAVQSPPTKQVVSPTSSTSSTNHRDSLTVPQSPPAQRQTTASSTTSPPKSQTQATSTPAQDPPRTNGSIHQPPPAETEPSASFASTSRDRSGTDSKKKISVQPTMSASLSGPVDFDPSHFYSSSIDSPTATASAAQSPVTATASSDMQKKDSISRTRGQYTRKTPGSLSRQSADSLGGGAAGGNSGVQLEDRPVDFD